VIFNDKQGFSYWRDLRIMKNEVMGAEFRMLETISKYNDGVVPPIFSWVFPGMCFLSVNSCEFLESIYV